MNSKLKYVIPAVAVLVVVILVGGYLFFQNKTAKPPTAEEETKKLVAEVSKLIDLPAETPTVATVSDINKLKDQPFFQKAKNGDKVLIFTNAKKAVLYDPNAKKIIDVAPINIGTPSAETTGPRVTLRNGTSTVGLTNKVETELKKEIAGLNVITKENADKEYDKTVVVVLSDFAKDYAENLASKLNASVGSLPEGENKPKDSDILVILGKDSI